MNQLRRCVLELLGLWLGTLHYLHCLGHQWDRSSLVLWLVQLPWILDGDQLLELFRITSLINPLPFVFSNLLLFVSLRRSRA